MVYTVEYTYQNELCSNNFIFEHEAKHFAIDLGYEGINDIYIREFGKTIGKIEVDSDMFYFIRFDSNT
jgi:hypothetical protein